MKIYYALSLFFLASGLQAQVPSSAVSQGELEFLAGTIYIEMQFPSERPARSEKNAEEENRIFPNPVTDFLYFQTKKATSKASVYDMGGKKIMECPVVDNAVDLRELQRGSYIIFIEGFLSQGQVFLKK